MSAHSRSRLGAPIVAAGWICLLCAAPANAMVRPRFAPRHPATALQGFASDAGSVAPAAAHRNEAALAAFQRGGRPFSAQWDAATGVVRSLTAGQSRPYGADLLAAARRALKDAVLFLGPDANIANGVVRPHALGAQVVFRQTVNGVPVLGREVVFNLSPKGEALTVENTTAPVGAVDTRPAISPLRAAALAGHKPAGVPALAIDASGDSPRLVWQFKVSAALDRLLRVTVDARTGEILRSENTVQRESITGKGRVYTGNPISTPDPIEAPFLYLDGSGTLTGSYAKVYRFTGQDENTYKVYGDQDAVSQSLTFDYDLGDPKAGEAQAYYGITTIHDYFKSTFGFTGRDVQTPAFTDIEGYDNAFYSPDTDEFGPNGGMAFGTVYDFDGNPYDYAQDSDVLYHEYTHAVVDKLNPTYAGGYSSNYDAGGMNEGEADYFSCSKLNDPVLGEWIAASEGYSYIRSLNDKLHFPQDVPIVFGLSDGTLYQSFPEVHQIGSIWGPACWELRRVLGAAKADQIIFHAISLFSDVTTLQNAVGFLLTTDAQMYNGADAATIRTVYGEFGLSERPYPVRYTTPDTFNTPNSRGGGSQIRTGYVYTDENNVFPDTPTDDYFYSFGLFPSTTAGRIYEFAGYSRDPSVSSVFLVWKGGRSRTIAWVGYDTFPVDAVTLSGAETTLSVFDFLYRIPTSFLNGQDKKGLTLQVYSFTQPAATVARKFYTTTPKAISVAVPAEIINGAQLN